MGTLTIRLADDKHDRLRLLAKSYDMSLNKLFEEPVVRQWLARGVVPRRIGLSKHRFLHFCQM